MAINTDIAVFWVTIPLWIQGSTLNTEAVPHLSDYNSAMAYTMEL